MQGILLVDKPTNWTSFDVVAFVRKLVAAEQNVKPPQVKVGHAGTLDPLATGLLVILIGKTYTRLAGDLTKLDKEYMVEMKLGEVTDSIDAETVPKFYSSNKPTLKVVDQALNKFIGEIKQTPPIYSAIKIDGRRAYKMARDGLKPEIKPRAVSIYKIKLNDYAYPYVRFSAKVSSGTYVRSLVNDLGKELKVGAYMSNLKRTKIGDFRIEESLKTEQLNFEEIAEHLYFI